MKAYDLNYDQLRILGDECGFDEIGATTADPFPEMENRLLSYAERGLTGFESSNVQERINPQRWLPGVCSVVSVAMAYLTPEGHELAHRHASKGRLDGRVTVYSFGQDYHKVMTERLNRLHQRIAEVVGTQVEAKVLVDTGPWIDRRIAERAGIGWVGKNCMFYTHRHGSYVFLGSLAVDIAIEPASAEHPSRCGDCERCLTACPTGALLAPGVIDAPRCLSYVTQMKGIIPEAFRKPLGRRVWGCDTCQWACPENREVAFANHAEYLPERELAYPELIEVLSWSNREFQRRYGKTAAAWRGVRTWQRNALIALGNCRQVDAVVHIVPFLKHERPELRASAAWALAQIDATGTRQAVLDALSRETDADVQRDMIWAVDVQTGK